MRGAWCRELRPPCADATAPEPAESPPAYARVANGDTIGLSPASQPNHNRDLIDIQNSRLVGGEVEDAMADCGNRHVRDEVSGADVHSYYQTQATSPTVPTRSLQIGTRMRSS